MFFFFFSSLQFSFSSSANTNEYANLNFLDYELNRYYYQELKNFSAKSIVVSVVLLD